MMRSRFSELAKVSPGKLRALIVAGIVCANLFVVAISIHSLRQSRQQAELRAQTLTQNMAQAVDQSLSNSIEKVDLALRSITDEFERQLAAGKIDRPSIDRFLDKYQQRLPEVEGIRVADAEGRVVFGKGVDPAARVSWADRDYFIYLRDHPDGGLQFSKPRVGRVAKTYIVGFSRRYNHPDGSFAGVVSAPIALEYFSTFLSGFNLGPDGALVLRDADLGLIARNPALANGSASIVGNSAVSAELRQLTDSGIASATYFAMLSSDQKARIVSFRRITAAPMIVLAGTAKDDYLADWTAEAYKTGAWALGFALLSLLSGSFVLYLLNRITGESLRNRLYLQHASDGIHILDEHGNIVEASDRFFSMLGYARSEAIGMNVADWEARWSREKLAGRILPKLLNQPGASTFETRHRKKNGEIIDVEVNVVGIAMGGKQLLYASSRDISERKRQQQALENSEARLRESEEHLRAIIENEPECVKVLDREGNLLQMNRAGLAMLEAQSLEEVNAQGLLSFVAAEHHEAFVALGQQVFQGKSGILEFEVVGKRGTRRWLETHAAPLRDASGSVVSLLGVTRDTTDRRRAESALRLAASVFNHAHEGFVICDAGQRILEVNPTFSEITGYTRDEVIGRTTKFLNSGVHPPAFYRDMWQTIEDKGFWEGEVWNRRKDGASYAELLNISQVRDSAGKVSHYIGTFSDISASKAHQAQLEHLAHYDALTSLPNRALLSDRMTQALAQSRRSGALVAVGYLDLDGFKAINDEFGHAAGDLLLIEVARRLKVTLRTGDTVARLGGDEFVLLMVGIGDVEECELAATRVLSALAAPITLNGQERSISGSLGIALSPPDDGDPDTLLRHADQAMYLAKQRGKNRYQISAAVVP